MRAFDVFVNGKKICRAGIDGYSVLSAITTSHVVDPESPTGKHIGEGIHPLDLMVGGLDVRNNQHLHWPKTDLNIGDEITIKIIETDDLDSIDTPEEYIMIKEPPEAASEASEEGRAH